MEERREVKVCRFKITVSHRVLGRGGGGDGGGIKYGIKKKRRKRPKIGTLRVYEGSKSQVSLVGFRDSGLSRLYKSSGSP